MSNYPPPFSHQNYRQVPQYNQPNQGFIQPNSQNQAPSNQNIQEIQLCENSSEREKYESLADLYAIIVATGRLEKLFLRGVSGPDYQNVCTELIAKYKTYEQMNPMKKEDFFGFCREFSIPDTISQAAFNRFSAGVDATIIFPGSKPKRDNSNVPDSSKILEATQNFITASNTVQMGLVAVDELYPYMKAVVDSLNELTNLKFEGRDIMIKWLTKLKRRGASDRLSEEEQRQLGFDLEKAYEMFREELKKN